MKSTAGLYDLIQSISPTKKTITEDTLLIEDLHFDSFALMSLIAEIEDTYEIEFDDSNILFESFNRVGDLRLIIEGLID